MKEVTSSLGIHQIEEKPCTMYFSTYISSAFSNYESHGNLQISSSSGQLYLDGLLFQRFIPSLRTYAFQAPEVVSGVGRPSISLMRCKVHNFNGSPDSIMILFPYLESKELAI